jgi:hypothetical protein
MGRSALGPPPLPPSALDFGRELLLGFCPLRLFDQEVSAHLVHSGRHAISQSPFHGKIRGVTLLTRGEFGRLLFGALLRGNELRLERFDMGLKRSDDLVGEPPFVRDAGAPSATLGGPIDFVPALRGPNPGSFVVSKRLLPPAAFGALPDGLGRHAQEFGGLPVGKPLARQIVPRPKTSDAIMPRRGGTLLHRPVSAQDKAGKNVTSLHKNDLMLTLVLEFYFTSSTSASAMPQQYE